MTDTVRLQGEGGVVWTFDLPLSEGVAEQVEKGRLKPVDPPPPAGSADEPPRHGKGSTADAWRTYAETLGLDVPDDAGRDDIIALVDER